MSRFHNSLQSKKLGQPFADLPSNIEVQKINGLNMGRILHLNVSCANITAYIASEMRTSFVSQIVSNQSPVAILVDESTTLSQKTTLIIYIRTVFPEAIDTDVTVFLDLVELEKTTAVCIASALLRALHSRGMSDDFLSDHFVGFACDGASVMLGRKAGVAKILMEKFPRLIVWHCATHRLELSVHDSLLEISGTNHFKSFMDKLYSLYHASPINRNELQASAKELEVQLLSIGRLLDTRLVASSTRTLKAVWQSYPALYAHFVSASQDTSRDTKERSCYRSLVSKLTSTEFVLNMGTMLEHCRNCLNCHLNCRSAAFICMIHIAQSSVR